MQVWANSYCRSTLAFYEHLAKSLRTPLRLCLARSGIGDRGAIGYDPTEFSHLEFVDVSSDTRTAMAALKERAHWPQLFGVYQSLPHIRAVIEKAHESGLRVAIASESPCNMAGPGIERLLRHGYLRWVAPIRFRRVVRKTRFIINWSGDASVRLQQMGWRIDQIIPCGYFPPPLVGSHFRDRLPDSLKNPVILCTGGLTWHRGADVLVEAVNQLKTWQIDAQTIFTGDGPLMTKLQRRADTLGLNCRFLGPVPMADLVRLYESCTIFVAPGRSEPWGIRVNDAINCGAPTVVSRGMGAHKLVDDHGAGTSFGAGDALDLAWRLRGLLTQPAKYAAICRNLGNLQTNFLPQYAAAQVADTIRSDYPDWIG